MENYHISKAQVEDTLEELYKHIESTSPIPILIRTDKTKSGGNTTRKPPYFVTIGTHDINTNTQNGYVNDNAFVFTVLVCFHEQQHIIQRYHFTHDKKASQILRHLAYTDLLNTTIPEYYKYGYWNDITEIDAELYGITETKKFFKINFPEIDINLELAKISKTTKWYDNTKLKTAEQIITSLKAAKKTSLQYACPITHPLYPKVSLQSKSESIYSR